MVPPVDGPTLRPRPQPESGAQPPAQLPVIQPDGGSEAIRRCKVEGCGKLLKTEKRFYQRARCCMEHAFAAEVSLGGGVIRRFCQQCCCFHALEAFEGDTRSCRRRLDAHNTRRQQQNRTFGFHRRRRPGAKAAAAKKAAASRACASSPGAASTAAERDADGSDAAAAADASGSGGSGGSLSEPDTSESDGTMARDEPGTPAAEAGRTAPLDAAVVPRRQRSKRSLSAQPVPHRQSVASGSRRRISADAVSTRPAAQAAILQLQEPQPQPQLHQQQMQLLSQNGQSMDGLAVPPMLPDKRFCSRSEPNFQEHQTWQQGATMRAAELPLPPPLPAESVFGAATSASEMQWQLASDLPSSLSSVHGTGGGGGGGGTAPAALVISCRAPGPLLTAGPWAHEPSGGAGSNRLQDTLHPQGSACMADLPAGWHPPSLRDDVAAAELQTQPLHAAPLSARPPLPPPLLVDGAAVAAAANRLGSHSMPAGMLASDFDLRDAAQLGVRSLSAPEPEATQLQQQLSDCAAAVAAHASGGFPVANGFQMSDWEVAQLELPLPLHPQPGVRQQVSDVEAQLQPSSAQHLSFEQPHSWQNPATQLAPTAAPLPGDIADSGAKALWVQGGQVGSAGTWMQPVNDVQRAPSGGGFAIAEPAAAAVAAAVAAAPVAGESALAGMPPADGMQHACYLPSSSGFLAAAQATGPPLDSMQHACDPHSSGGSPAATAATGCLPAAEAVWPPPFTWGPETL